MVWSWKFWPTPGRSTTIPIFAASRSFFGPTPLSCRICGLWMPPAERITSFLTLTMVVSAADFAVAATKATPVAVVPSKTILVTFDPVKSW